MQNSIIQFLAPVFLMGFGVLGVTSSRILRRETEVCTETVAATVVEAQRFRLRSGYTYYYVLRYTWNSVDYERQYTAPEALGNAGDEAVIHINPMQPEQIRSAQAEKRSRYCLIAGIVMIVIGAIWLIAALINWFMKL